ncbi:phosphoglucosamine mutase [Ectothiorhodospiraceae bacterium 2226]|nr:phosphoglucosamine mutase [Ectothiorhodospiraceae bacterium 2226]
MNKRFFGTDGIRGRVGEPPVTPEFVLKLGWAAGRVLSPKGGGSVLIGKDTRISGYMFESALEAGLSAAGVDIRLLGPMPTPAIAYLTRTLGARGGIVISASHNPYSDNGIKFFSAAGEKLSDESELAIEAALDAPLTTVDSAALGKASRVPDAPGRYIEFCKNTLPRDLDFSGMTIVVDCANGASYHVAPSVFAERGARVIPLGVEPNGLNINDGCGSTAPQALQAAVLAHGADLGIALDGDGDRVIMVDHKGELVDGDELLFIIARDRHQTDRLSGGVVGTVMSNLGLEHALDAMGIPFARAPVGDRHVLERLQQDGWVLGGESSGHILCLDRASTGDGIVSALQVLAAVVRTGVSLHALKAGMNKCPQVLLNVPVVRRFEPGEDPRVSAAVTETEAQLGGRGRVLLRASGTEALIRVMVEGEDGPQVEAAAQQLAAVVREAAAAHA